MSKSSEKNENQTTKKAEESQAASVVEDKAASKEADFTSAEETKDTDSASAEEHQEESDRVDGRAWQVAQLAAQMVSRGGIYGRLENPEWAWAEEFQIARVKEAVRTAHLVLELATQPVDEQISASTLFEPGDALNSRQIAERFENVGWPNLGETKVRERLSEIQECWKRVITEKQSMASKMDSGRESAIRKIANALASLAGDSDVFLTIDDFQGRASSLLQAIRAEMPPPPTSPKIEAERLQLLHKWCFPDDVIERPKRTKGERLFRIHELLRFAEEKFEEQIVDLRQRHRFHQISDSGLNEELQKAELWLPEPLRARPLESLKPPFNRSAFNSPPTREATFQAYNHHRVVDPALRYPR